MKVSPNVVLITAECLEEASKLRAHCEAKFPVGEAATNSRSITGESFTELAMTWSKGYLSPEEARDAAEAHFDRYAAKRTGTLYWRVVPEIALSTKTQRYAYYLRLLISNKPRKQ